MATETKIGFALIVVLVTAFALVVYQKQAKQQELIAQLKDVHKEGNEKGHKKISPASLASKIEEERNPVEISSDPFADEKVIVEDKNQRDEPQTLPIAFRNQSKQPAQLMPIEIKEAETKESGDQQEFDPFTKPKDTPEEVASNGKRNPAQLDGNLESPKEDTVDNPFGDDVATEQKEPAQQERDPFEIEVKPGKKEMSAQQLPEQDPFDKPETKTEVIQEKSSTTEAKLPPEGFEEPTQQKTEPKIEQKEEPFFEEPVVKQATPLPQELPPETGDDDPFDEPKEADSSSNTLPPEDDLFPETPQQVKTTKPSTTVENDQKFSDTDFPPVEKKSEEDPFAHKKSSSGSHHGDQVYEVQHADNYWNISKVVYGKGGYFRALAKYNLNRIQNPNKLSLGMKVLVPSVDELHQRYPKDCPRRISTTKDGRKTLLESGFRLDPKGNPTYIVGGGDTLGSIAQGHLGRASRWVQIYQMNRDAVKNPKKLKIGTVLQLPADASRVRLVQKNPMSR